MIIVTYLFIHDMDKAAFYAFTPEECNELAPHIARLAPKVEEILHTPEWAHNAMVTSSDSIGLLTFAIGYLDRVGALEKMGSSIWAGPKLWQRKGQHNNGQPTGSTLPVSQGEPTNNTHNEQPGNNPVNIGTYRRPGDFSGLAALGIGSQYG